MSQDPVKADQEDVILSVKLPVRCSVLGLLATTLAGQYGLGILMRQVGDHLEFFTPQGYEPPERDDEAVELLQELWDASFLDPEAAYSKHTFAKLKAFIEGL